MLEWGCRIMCWLTEGFGSSPWGLLMTWQLASNKRQQYRRESDQDRSFTVLYNLILAVTCHYSHHIGHIDQPWYNVGDDHTRIPQEGQDHRGPVNNPANCWHLLFPAIHCHRLWAVSQSAQSLFQTHYYHQGVGPLPSVNTVYMLLML